MDESVARDTVRPPRHRMAGGHQELLRPPLRSFWVLRAEPLQPEPDHPRLPLPHGRPSCRRVPLAAGRRGALPGTVPRPRPRCCSALGGATATIPTAPSAPHRPSPGEALALPKATRVSLFSRRTRQAVCALWEFTLSISGSVTGDSGGRTRGCDLGSGGWGRPLVPLTSHSLAGPCTGTTKGRAPSPLWGGEEKSLVSHQR